MNTIKQTPDPNRYAAANVRAVSINGLKIVARRETTSAEIKKWFEEKEGFEADDFRIVSLLDPHENGSVADAIRQIDFESARLPRFL